MEDANAGMQHSNGNFLNFFWQC